MEANPMLQRREIFSSSSCSRIVFVVMVLLVIINLSHCVSSDTKLKSFESQGNTSTISSTKYTAICERNKMDKECLIAYNEEELEYQMDSEINRRILLPIEDYTVGQYNNQNAPSGCGRGSGKTCTQIQNAKNRNNCRKGIYTPRECFRNIG